MMDVSKRRKTSSGQAIVMVTLALLAMGGMMGLALDLGWSFFVAKQAQAAADGAAVAAVQQAYKNVSVVGGTGTGCPAAFTCLPERDCNITGGTSPMASACLFAQNNGFTYNGSRQKVRFEANVPSVKAATGFAPGVTDLSYWVTVKVVQTIPQLFSALQGTPVATIAAVSTAGIVRESLRASLVGLNQANDCTHSWSGTSFATGSSGCGVNVNLAGNGGTCAGGTYHICAPDNVVLASSCNGSSQAGCAGTVSGTGTNYAGTADVSAANTPIGGNGKVNPVSRWTPTQNGALNSQIQDPTTGLTQPPLAANQAPPSCGILQGTITGTTPQTLGPYQYYAYTSKDASGKPIPTGAPIQIARSGSTAAGTTLGTSVTFSPNGTCPGILSSGTSQSGNAFPMYVFYGGLNIQDSGNGNGTTGTTKVNFGAGQYVMAGTSQTSPATVTTSGTVSATGMVFSAVNATITGDGTAASTAAGTSTNQGTMFVLTDGSYSSGAPGASSLATMMAATVPNSSSLASLKQGSSLISGGNVDLSGLNKPGLTGQGTSLTDYAGTLIWQDRRNSTDNIDPATGKYLGSTPPASNNVNGSQTSPGMILATGGGYVGASGCGADKEDTHPAAMKLSGVIYQPRGAWLALGHALAQTGGQTDIAATWNLKVQLITGAVIPGPNVGTGAGSGSTFMQLAAANNTLSRYKVALIR